MEYLNTWTNDHAGLYRHEYAFTNNKGEKVEIWISNQPHDRHYKKDLMNQWVKAGYMPEFIAETLHVELFVTDENGNCYNRYNPQINYETWKIDFSWILEATAENINKILAEIERRANA